MTFFWTYLSFSHSLTSWDSEINLYSKDGLVHSEHTYTLYIVQCSDGTFYTGIAKDLDARIDLHNAGKGARYTRDRRPVKLVYSEILENKSLALRREYEIKTWSRSRKLKLIQGRWNA